MKNAVLAVVSLPLFVYSLFPIAASNSSRVQEYLIPGDLERIAMEYQFESSLPEGVTRRDFLVFADVIATERAAVLVRKKEREDYEFGLAVACLPIPNWPKNPPPPPPPPGEQQRVREGLRLLMKGVDEEESKRRALRDRLDRKLLALSSDEFRKGGLIVTAVLGDLASISGGTSLLRR